MNMATTTPTSSATLPSLLDLLGAPAAPLPGSKAGAAFDTLLQPPSDAPAEVDCHSRTNHADTLPETDRGSAQSLPRPPAAERPLNDQADWQARDEADDAIPATDDASLPSAELPLDDPATRADEQIVAESLAGMTACVLPVPPPKEAASGEESADADGKPELGRRGARSRNTPGDQPGGAGTAAPAGGESEPATQAARQPDETTQATASATGNLSENLAGKRGDGHSERAEATAQSASEEIALVADSPLVMPVEKSMEHAAVSREAKSPSDKLELAQATAEQSTDVSLAAETTATDHAVPLVAPAAAPQSTRANEGTSDRNAAVTANGSSAAGPTRRPRLPAEMLAPDAGRAARSSSPNIDTTRLLTRVARAFAAAQQRDGEIQLRLSPPELGSLKLTVQMQDGGMVARLETETAAAKTALIENLPALRERLAEQGVRIERFDVDLMQRQPGGMPDRPGDQQRETPPAPRAEPRVLRADESIAASRGPLAKASSPSGLNVIV
jgi:flagellar hook-length control protein FliK